MRAQARNQRGFTLIELLVVISIIGILAAIVTMSMVGITSIATQRAGQAEEQAVQTAFDTMTADQGVPQGVAPGSCNNGQSDMTSFPSGQQPPADGSASHVLVALAPKYLHSTTHGKYSCADDGHGGVVVHQDSYTP